MTSHKLPTAKTSSPINISIVTGWSPGGEEPFATWNPTGGYIKKESDIGDLEFHGEALSGDMGVLFNLLGVLLAGKMYVL